MSSEGLIFSLILMAVVALIVLMPMFGRKSDELAEALASKQRERLAFYYERVLRNLHDLDEDHTLGKISDDDYERDRAVWLQRGAQALRALDGLNLTQMTAEPAKPKWNEPALVLPRTSADDSAVDRAIDDAIESAIQAYREKQTN
jgi:cytochrome c-type biogenesis protein CcmI